MLTDLLVYSGKKLLSVKYAHVKEFVALLNAFRVKIIDTVKVVPFKLLYIHGSLSLLRKFVKYYIIETMDTEMYGA